MDNKLDKKIWGILADYVDEDEARKIKKGELSHGEFEGLIMKYDLDLPILTLKQKELEKLENELLLAEKEVGHIEDELLSAQEEVYDIEDKISIIQIKIKELAT